MSQGFIHTSESITATNGLTKTAGNITLGGALSTNTTISGSYTLSFTNTSVSIATGIFSTQTTFNFATASTVPYLDASKSLVSSAVTPTELGLLSGITGFTGYGTLIAKGTSPTFTTDITTPLIIGGSAVGSQLNLKSTSASGTSTVAGINFLVGNNGATTAGSVYNSGQVNIGNYASPTNLRIFTVGQDTAFVSIGSRVTSTGSGAIYFCSGTPSNSNWGISSDGSGMEIQAMATDGTFNIRTGNTIRLQLTGVKTSGAITGETHTLSDNTNQTLSTAIPKVLFTLGSTQWATGALAATQKFFSITQPTISFVGASTATLVATVGIAGAPIQGTNATNTTSVGLLIEAGAITGATTSYGAYFNAQTGGSTNYAFGTNGDVRISNATGFTQHTIVNANAASGVFSYITSNSNTLYLAAFGTAAASTTFGLNRAGATYLYVDGGNYLGFGTTSTTPVVFATNNLERIRIISGGQVGVGVTAPTAALHLMSGTAAASTAPLKFTSGTNLTTAEAGAMEYDGSNLYFTNSTPTRILLTQSFPMGETYMTGNATATTIASSGVYYKVSGTTTLSHAHEFTAGGTDNRLTYTGTITKTFHVACTLSVKSAGSNDIIYARIAKNGTTIPAGTVQQKLGSIGDVASTAIHVVVELATNDYIELFVMNNSGTSSLTVTDMNMFGMGIYH